MADDLYKERHTFLQRIEKMMEGPMIFLGFVWLVLLVFEFIQGLHPILEKISLTIWIIFIVDFVIKFFIAPNKISFIKRNVLTAISLVIPAVRIFRFFAYIRILRAARGLQLVRVISSINRSMKSLSATMERRAFGYVVLLTILVAIAGAAGMFAFEKANAGFKTFGESLWWTGMRLITAGSEAWPVTPEGRFLAFLIALYGYAIFGYVTATLATFFIGRDAEENDTSVAGAKDVEALRKEVQQLTAMIQQMNSRLP